MNLSYLIQTCELNLINSSLLNEIQLLPNIKKNTAYIVGVVLLNEKNQVCLIQEAKSSCYKKWYLPAGRLEINENLNEAVVREALEETGFVVMPVSLFCVETSQNGNWFRFTFTARIIGGSLKTLDKADSESICAQWFDLNEFENDDFLKNLRSGDFIRLVHLGAKFYSLYGINSFTNLSEANYNQIKSTHNLILPDSISKRAVVFVFFLLSEDCSKVLLYENSKFESPCIPAVVIQSYAISRSNLNCLDFALQHVLFGHCFKTSENISFKSLGILAVKFLAEHSHHGIQLFISVRILNEKDYDLKSSYKWVKLDKNYELLKNEQFFVKLVVN